MDTRGRDSAGSIKGSPGTKSDKPEGAGEKGWASECRVEPVSMGADGPQAWVRKLR